MLLTGDDRLTPPTHEAPCQVVPAGGPAISDPARHLVVARLAQIAGDLERWIEMAPSGSAEKYLWRTGVVTPELVERHLAGEITVGAELRRRDGRTHALIWDVDDKEPAQSWPVLLAVGGKLLASGAVPILARSPRRGGHLWLVFVAPVDPGAARATAERHAPELVGVTESWPTRDGSRQAVRLLGGRYRGHDDAGNEIQDWVPHTRFGEVFEWVTGWEAAALALTARTPAAWVTEPAPPVAAGGARRSPRAAEGRGIPVLDAQLVEPLEEPPLPAAAADPVWRRRNWERRGRMEAWILPEQAAAWYNALGSCEGLYDADPRGRRDERGYALAFWRGEQTPSVWFLSADAWIDYGDRGRRPDGRRDGGDRLELRRRLEGVTRPQLLTQVTVEMARAVREELRGAAKASQGVAGWAAAVTSPVGWALYRRLRGMAVR